MNQAIYFDYSATTPVDERVLSAMQPYFSEIFGNSVSQLHSFGWDADAAVEKARRQVATALKVSPREIFFTSGATESNNWAMQGLVEAWHQESPNAPIHIITSNIEHNSITKVLEHLQKNHHVEVDFLPVDHEGRLSAAQIAKAIKPHTKLISLMWVNNELGSINPMDEISQLARERKIYLHSDATQALGKIPVNLEHTKVDLLSLSAHKIYGPKGAGALYVRSQNPKVQILPLFYGGGQERGLRSGTLNVPGIVGLGKAMEILAEEVEQDAAKSWKLREQLLQSWRQTGLEFRVNGSAAHSVAQIINITFLQAARGSLAISGLAFSKGSACHSDNEEPSHVLTAIGVNADDAEKTLRLSFGRMSSEEDFRTLSQIVLKKMGKL